MSYVAAQTAPASQPAVAEEGEIVQLDTFHVVSGEATGYSADDTITGTRTASLLRDLPFAVSVVMSEFMEDFALFELGDQLGYTTSSFTPDDGAGENYYSLRGFGQTTLLKNGFRRGGLVDRVNISRIEVIKGPSAAMYGQTEPGGMINYITYKPKSKREVYLAVSGGAYDTQRAELRATGRLLKSALGETCYLISAASHQREFEQQYRSNDQKSAVLMLSHKFPNNKTIINLEYGQVKQIRRRASTIPYLVGGSTVATGRDNRLAYADELFNFCTQGTNSFVTRENNSIEGSVEHRINQVWSLRVASYYADRDYWRLQNTGDRYDPVGRNILLRRENWHVLHQTWQDVQFDLIGLWRKKDVEHRVLVTFDYNYLRGFSTTWRGPTAAGDTATTLLSSQRNLSVDNPDYGLRIFPEWINSATLMKLYEEDGRPLDADGRPLYTTPDRTWTFGTNTGYNRKNSVYGMLTRYQISAMQNRLIVLAGARFDLISFTGYTMSRGPYELGAKEPTPYGRAFSPQIGINYKLSPNHTVYANYSRSFKPFTPNTDTEEEDMDDEISADTYHNETGIGYEAGIRSIFFDDRLRVTLNLYSIEKRGMKTVDVMITGWRDIPILDEDTGEVIDTRREYDAVSKNRTVGIIKSDGIEIDFEYKVGKNMEIMGVWGYANPRYTYTGNDADLLGRLPQRVANMNAAMLARYEFTSGELKGLRLTAGVRYTGYSYATIDNTYTSNAAVAMDGTYVTSNDGRRDIRTPAYTTCDVGVSYMWKMGQFRHRVQLNARNVLNEKYITTSAYAGDRLAIYASYVLRY